MSSPAYTVAADRIGGEALLDMLDRGIRHFPVRRAHRRGDRRGRGRRPRGGRHAQLVPPARGDRAREDASSELAEAAAGLMPTVVALHDARVAASDVAAIHVRGRRRARAPPARADRGRVGGAGGPVRVARARQRRAPRGGPLLGHRQRAGLVRRRSGRRPGAAGDRRAGPRRPRALRPRLPTRRARWRPSRCSRAPTPPGGRGALVAREPHPGEGADPRLADRRRARGVGDPHRSAGARGVPGRPAPS